MAGFFLLAACGGRQEEPLAQDRSSRDRPQTAPLIVALVNGLPYGASYAEVDRQAEEVNAQVQAAIRTCMDRLGFDYQPVSLAARQIRVGAELSEREFAEEYGYGISTQLVPPTPLADPNDEQFFAMSESEQEAWIVALEGAVGGSPGCIEQASMDVGAPTADAYVQLDALVVDLESTISNDVRMVDLTRQWTACMASSGFDEVIMGAMAQVVVEAGSSVDWSDPLATEEFQEWERAAAVADLECLSPIRDEVDALRAELVADFVEENATLLGSFVPADE